MITGLIIGVVFTATVIFGGQEIDRLNKENDRLKKENSKMSKELNDKDEQEKKRRNPLGL